MTRIQLVLVRIAMLPVLVAAAWNSYWHTVHVAQKYGQDDGSAYMLPLSVDGLMLVASLVVTSAKSTRAKLIGYTTLALGFGGSFACNMLATEGGLIAHLVSGWYAISLLLGVELFQHTNKRTVAKPTVDRKAAAAKAAATRRRKADEAAAQQAPVKPAPRRTRSKKAVEAAPVSAPVLATA